MRHRALLTVLLVASTAAAQDVRFHVAPDDGVARIPRDSLRNENGSIRVWSESNWTFVMERIAPLAVRWSRDDRLRIAPGYLLALIIKESAGDSLAVSPVPALGLAQLTARTDSDMRVMVTEWHFQWMAPEVDAWPRAARIHRDGASAASVDSLLRNGAVTSRDEYLFDPVRAARAAVFWLRLLENRWTSDFWPGGDGPFVRRKLNGGAPLTETQLLDLVTVSYNRGYIRVHDLVARYGAAWLDHLEDLGVDGAEARDYLRRVRDYTARLEGTVIPPPR